MDIPASSLADLSAKQGEEVTLESVAGRNQRMMTKQIDQNNLQILKNQLEKQRDIARLNSLGLPFAGAWLVSAPVVSLGLHLQPHEFVLALKYRLGMAIYDREGPCPACLRPSDRFGDHALCCGFWGERITRHNLLRDHLYDLAASACLSPIKEGRFLLPGADRRPADVLLPSWEGGRDAALDVTVVNSLQEAMVEDSATRPGSALDKAYDRKMRGAAEDCLAQGIVFLPLAAEALGGWHEMAVNKVKKLASAVARQTGQED